MGKSGLNRITAVINEENRQNLVEMTSSNSVWRVEQEEYDGKYVFLTFKRQ